MRYRNTFGEKLWSLSASTASSHIKFDQAVFEVFGETERVFHYRYSASNIVGGTVSPDEEHQEDFEEAYFDLGSEAPFILSVDPLSALQEWGNCGETRGARVVSGSSGVWSHRCGLQKMKELFMELGCWEGLSRLISELQVTDRTIKALPEALLGQRERESLASEVQDQAEALPPSKMIMRHLIKARTI